MKIVKVTCPNCNSSVDFEEGEKQVTCKYCDTTFLIDDGSIQVEHIIQDDEKLSKYKNAEAILKLGDFDQAYILFNSLSKEYIYDSEIWYNLLRCKTGMFNVEYFFYVVGKDDERCLFLKNYKVILNKNNELFDKYSKLEKNKNLLEKRTKEYHEFVDKIEEKTKKLIDEMNNVYKENNKEYKKKIAIIIVCAIILTIIYILVFKSAIASSTR